MRVDEAFGDLIEKDDEDGDPEEESPFLTNPNGAQGLKEDAAEPAASRGSPTLLDSLTISSTIAGPLRASTIRREPMPTGANA